MASEPQPCLLLHVLPYDGIGGAEIAARTAAEASQGKVRVHFLATWGGEPETDCPWITHGTARRPGQWKAIAALLRLIGQVQPKTVLFSLWKSLPAMLAVKARFARVRLALFLHLTHHFHAVDAVSTRLMALMADELWADSERSAIERAGSLATTKPVRTISFMLRSVRPGGAIARTTGPHFISWCRLTAQKRIHLAIQLIARIQRHRPDVRYTIIGPDGGTQAALQEEVEKLDLEDQVRFLGVRDWPFIEDESRRATFFLQLSAAEGQSMAVVEAMQLGLVPVVTPVGAIADYCDDGRNAIFYRDRDDACARILEALDSPDRLTALSKAASETFSQVTLYADDMMKAASESADQPMVSEFR